VIVHLSYLKWKCADHGHTFECIVNIFSHRRFKKNSQKCVISYCTFYRITIFTESKITVTIPPTHTHPHTLCIFSPGKPVHHDNDCVIQLPEYWQTPRGRSHTEPCCPWWSGETRRGSPSCLQGFCQLLPPWCWNWSVEWAVRVNITWGVRTLKMCVRL